MSRSDGSGSSSALRRGLVRAGDAALTVLAVVGVLGAASFVLIRLHVAQPLVVVSGSMEPVYGIGDLIVSRTVDATSLHVGDVASLPSARRDVLVTHRVVAVEPHGDGSVDVRMKGDANATADTEVYVARTALVPVFSVPGGGRVIETLMRPSVAIPAVVALVSVVGMVLLTPSRRSRQDPDDDPPGVESGTTSQAVP